MWSLLRTFDGREAQERQERFSCPAHPARPALRALVLTVIALSARAAAAQSVERFTIDSVVSIDSFGGDNVSSRPQLVVDISTGLRIDDHWQLVFRPWLRQLRPPAPGVEAPDAEAAIFQAGLRYERSGTIGTRVDLGYLVSPIGLGMLDSRASLNPVIAGHVSYAAAMPIFEPTGPRASAVTMTYPLGLSATMSADHWDARAAIVNSSPTRAYMLGHDGNPRQSANAIVGAGVTPMIGLRIGASFARGAYATSDEIVGPSADSRTATIVGAESEYSFGYTVLRGEVLRTSFETAADNAVVYEWFLQGTQTLTPRWFVAARHEGTSAPPSRTATATGPRTDLGIVEATAGYRATPDVTLRASYYARRFYGASAWDQQIAGSVVWARRWW